MAAWRHSLQRESCRDDMGDTSREDTRDTCVLEEVTDREGVSNM